MLINSNTLFNNSSLPLILTNNSDHKIYIPNDIIIGTTERINSNHYHCNEITFNNDNKPQHVATSYIPVQKDHINKINSDSNKPQDVTTSGTHIPNNLVLKTNFNDKMQNVTNLDTTIPKHNTAINLLITPQENKTSDAKQLPCPIKDSKVIISTCQNQLP